MADCNKKCSIFGY